MNLHEKRIQELNKKYNISLLAQLNHKDIKFPYILFFKDFCFRDKNEKEKATGDYLWIWDDKMKRNFFYNCKTLEFEQYYLNRSIDYENLTFRYITELDRNNYMTHLIQIDKLNDNKTIIYKGHNISFFQYSNGKVAFLSTCDNDSNIQNNLIYYDERTKIFEEKLIELNERLDIQGFHYPNSFATSKDMLYKINIHDGIVYKFNLNFLSPGFSVSGRGDYKNGLLAISDATSQSCFILKTQ